MRRTTAGAACAFAAVLFAASAAQAANRIYFSNYLGNTVSWENLDGSRGGQISTGGAPIDGPNGVALDLATGRIYWANYGIASAATTIGWAMLDGSGVAGTLQPGGATINRPHGVAIDPVTRRIYWPNAGDSGAGFNGISWAALDGSGGADLSGTLGCSDEPRGVTIDPAARKIYWANHSAPMNSGHAIASSDLSGNGCAFVPTGSATNTQPEGVAIDPVTQTIYWASFSAADKISWTKLDGSAGGDLTTGTATVDHPHGITIDPTARKIYWANADANVLSWAYLDGSGGGDIPTPPGANPNGPDQPSLLEVPVGTGAPSIAGGSRPGSTLSCSQAKWAGDISEAVLYRAPQRITDSWTRNGAPIAGASSRTTTASSVGNYRCVETASNPAGSTTQGSDSLAIFKIGKVRRNEKKGTATLSVTVPDPGTLSLTGHGVRDQQPVRAGRTVSELALHVQTGTVKVPIRPNGKAKRRLRRTGFAKVQLELTYRPSGEASEHQGRKLDLRQKLPAGR